MEALARPQPPQAIAALMSVGKLDWNSLLAEHCDYNI